MTVFHFGMVILTCSVGNLSLSAPLYYTKLRFVAEAGGGFALVPSSEFLSEFPLTILTALFFALSATFHFGNATIWRKQYMHWLDEKKSVTRWVEYYFSASVMILLIGYATALRSFVEMFYAFFLVATTITFGWVSDSMNRPRSEDEWENPSVFARLIPHLLGYIPMLAVWTGLFFTLATNANECGPPAYVYVLVIGEFVLFISFGIPQLYQIIAPPRKYIYGEYVYQILSLIAKGTLGGILLAFVLLYDTFEESVDGGVMANCNLAATS